LRPRHRHGPRQAVTLRRGVSVERAGRYAGGGGGARRARVRRARNVRVPSVLEPLVTVRLLALVLVLAAGTVSAQQQFYYLATPTRTLRRAPPATSRTRRCSRRSTRKRCSRMARGTTFRRTGASGGRRSRRGGSRTSTGSGCGPPVDGPGSRRSRGAG